jgi:TRAP-type uncharacterized transport system fused permease subunit
MRLGIVVFLLPFTFVYDPDLLLIGDNMGQATLHISTCALGIAFWAWGLEGYFRERLGIVPCTLLMIAGVMLIWPNAWISMAGLAIGVLGLLPSLKGLRLRRPVDHRTEIDG